MFVIEALSWQLFSKHQDSDGDFSILACCGSFAFERSCKWQDCDAWAPSNHRSALGPRLTHGLVSAWCLARHVGIPAHNNHLRQSLGADCSETPRDRSPKATSPWLAPIWHATSTDSCSKCALNDCLTLASSRLQPKLKKAVTYQLKALTLT